jgi:hypothetical protein
LKVQSVFKGFVMGNPFFPPDIPAQSGFGAPKGRGRGFTPFLPLVIGGAWLALSFAVILLTLGDARSADKTCGAFTAELE